MVFLLQQLQLTRNMTFEWNSQRIELSKEDLISLGFKEENHRYYRRFSILNNAFFLDVFVDQGIETEVIDTDTGEPYTLYKLNSLPSGFAYQVKMAVEEVLESQFSPFYVKTENFVSRQFDVLKAVIEEKFQEQTDCPFKEDLARAFRLSKNRKWYGLVINVKASKLGLGSDTEIPILLLRGPKGHAEDLVDNVSVFPSYHMNKKNWVSVPLDYKASDDEVLSLLLSSREYVDKGL